VTESLSILDQFLCSYGQTTTQDILQHWWNKNTNYFIYNGIFYAILWIVQACLFFMVRDTVPSLLVAVRTSGMGPIVAPLYIFSRIFNSLYIFGIFIIRVEGYRL
jgi:hypothetical protein